MRKLIGKRLAVGILAAAMMMAGTVTAFAAQGWNRNDIGWWYEYENGTYPTDSWQMINGVWYHFDQAGYMDTGWVLDKDGRWYFTNADGAMLTGWVVVENQGYYLNPISNGYKGAMVVGTVEIDGQTYTFDESGACTTGFPRPGKAYYRNGVEVTSNQERPSGSGSGGSSDDSNNILEDLNNEIESNVKNAVEDAKNNPDYEEILSQDGVTDKPIKHISTVKGSSEENKKIEVTLGSEELQKETTLDMVKPLVKDLMDSSIVNSKEVETVHALNQDFTWEDAQDYLDVLLSNTERTLDTLSDEYQVTITLKNGDSVTYTLTIKNLAK